MSEGREIAPHVSIVVFSRDSKEALVRCLTSISRLDYPNITVFLADSGSTAYDPHAVESLFDGLILLETEGYPGAARCKNVALARILKMRRTEFVLLLDEATIVHPRLVRLLIEAHDPQRGWDVLQPAVYELESPETLYGYGGRFSPYTGRVSLNRRLPRLNDPSDEAARVDVAFSYAMFTHRNVFDIVGLFDEWLFPDDSDDVDLCLRVARRNHGAAVLADAIVWLGDGGARAPARDSFARGRSRSLLVRRYGRVHQRTAYFLLSPLLAAAGVLGATLRGRPVAGLAAAMGMFRGLTMSMRRPEMSEPEEPDSGEWSEGALPDKGQGSASPR
jgi:GT2 family glycosyltransferase